MNLDDVKRWREFRKDEFYRKEANIINWMIDEIERLEKALADTERMWREEKAKNKERL